MQTYLILSRFNEGDSADPGHLKEVAGEVSRRIKTECPGVDWKHSFLLLGSFDVADLVEAESPEAVAKAALVIRSRGNAETQTMLAAPWDDFLAGL